MMKKLALVACMVMATASAAGAVVLPTSFLAAEKPFKGLVAGSTVTATLYSDPACTAFVADQTIAVEDVDVRERLQPLKIKHDPAKPQNGVRLHFTFTLGSPSGDLYLQVTSGVPGAVVGIPSDCQPQVPASSAGPSTCTVRTTDAVFNNCGGAAVVTASCLGGEQVHGGGFETACNIPFYVSKPDGTTGWTVRGGGGGGVCGSCSGTVYAVCCE